MSECLPQWCSVLGIVTTVSNSIIFEIMIQELASCLTKYLSLLLVSNFTFNRGSLYKKLRIIINELTKNFIYLKISVSDVVYCKIRECFFSRHSNLCFLRQFANKVMKTNSLKWKLQLFSLNEKVFHNRYELIPPINIKLLFSIKRVCNISDILAMIVHKRCRTIIRSWCTSHVFECL